MLTSSKGNTVKTRLTQMDAPDCVQGTVLSNLMCALLKTETCINILEVFKSVSLSTCLFYQDLNTARFAYWSQYLWSKFSMWNVYLTPVGYTCSYTYISIHADTFHFRQININLSVCKSSHINSSFYSSSPVKSVCNIDLSSLTSSAAIFCIWCKRFAWLKGNLYNYCPTYLSSVIQCTKNSNQSGITRHANETHT